MEGRRLQITGRVQGVSYRASMVREAKLCGALGWVRNRLDGSVEAHICGSPQVIAEMIAWARRGPPAADVHQVLVRDEPAATDTAGFQQLPTA